MNILKDISLKKYNSFNIDVRAKGFIEVFSPEELDEVLGTNELKNISTLILGGGNNILFTKNFDGLVIKNSIQGIKIVKEDHSHVFVEAGAGVMWGELVKYCIERNFGGIENLSLIPGTVGAAPIQNIGAYGRELKDVFYKLHGMFLENLEEGIFYKNDCNFKYRTSIFKQELKNKFIITYITLCLDKNPVPNFEYGTLKNEIEKLNLQRVTIQDISKVISSIRINKLPDPKKLGNAGSFFKNPEISVSQFDDLRKNFPDMVGYLIDNNKVKLSAGWLIEKCGWKGKRVGNTGPYEKQALVLVNYGGALGEEILNVSRQIKQSILQKFGLYLEEEVNII